MKNTLQSINEWVKKEPAGFVRAVEEEYHAGIEQIARHIAADDDIRLVAIAGPSGSGKTTTAHLLRDDLQALDENTAVVSLDDFYLPLERAPILEDGSRDTESVNALDLPLMKRCFDEIIRSGRTQVPVYDFKTSRRAPSGRTVEIGSRGIVIVEGLHALNPVITGLVERKNIYKLYISVNSPILDESGVLLTSRRLRFVRRALRDEIFRGADIGSTLSMWESVGAGEQTYLYSFKETADVQLKTLHLYEPCVYRERFLKMRAQITEGLPGGGYFLPIAAALERFEPMAADLVPENSLIREFIGSGKYNS